MDDMRAELASLRATMQAGFESNRRQSDERHSENRERLQRIENKQDLTNGRVERHDSEIQSLYRRLKDAPSAVTVTNLKWGWALVAGTAALVYFLMLLAGFKKP